MELNIINKVLENYKNSLYSDTEFKKWKKKNKVSLYKEFCSGFDEDRERLSHFLLWLEKNNMLK